MPTLDEKLAAATQPRLFRERAELIKLLTIFSVVFAAYSTALSNGFVMDDFDLVVNNPNVKGLARLPRIFLTGYWDAMGVTGGLYRPLTIFSFFLEHTVAGINPLIYHLDNVLLHFLCSILCYLIFREIFKEGNAPFFAALIFAAHPVHTEAVAWVSGRAELLSAFLSLVSILLFIRRPGHGSGYAVLAPTSYLLALLSKESAVVVIPLLVVYVLLFHHERYSGRMRPLKALSGLYPYLAVSALYFALRAYALWGEMTPAGTNQTLYGLGAYDRFLTMCQALYEYIRLGFLPFDFKAIYIFPPPASLIDMKVFSALLSVMLLVFAASGFIRVSRPLLFAAAWFFIALIPVSNIIPIGVIMSERAMYMPSLGLCMILGHAFDNKRRIYAASLLVIVLAVFTAGALLRNPVWRDSKALTPTLLTMAREDIKRYPDYPSAYLFCARVQANSCDCGPETEKSVREAAKRLGTDEPEMHSMLADVYDKGKKPVEALREIRAAIKLDPQAQYYYHAALILRELKDYDEEDRMLDAAIKANPNRECFFLTKGELLMEQGDDTDALKLFEHAEKLDPEDQDAYLDEGIALDSMKQFGPAVVKVRKAVELRPDIPDLHYFLAVALLDNGQKAEANAELKEALRLKPGYKEAQGLLQKASQPGR